MVRRCHPRVVAARLRKREPKACEAYPRAITVDPRVREDDSQVRIGAPTTQVDNIGSSVKTILSLPSMLPLLLVVLCGVAMAIILKLSESHGADRLVVAGTDYVVAAALGAIFASDLTPVAREIGFAALVGAAFVAGFLTLMRGLNRIGMAIPASAARLSMLVPVIGSIIFFDEHPSGFQMAGIAAGTLAFALLGASQRDESETKRIDTGAILLLGMIFLTAGLSDFSMKIASELGMQTGRFITYVFAVAGLYCAIAVAIKRTRLVKRDLLLGALLGIPNFFAAHFIFQALEQLPTGIVYPIASAGGVVGATAAALIIWKEKPTRTGWIGIGMAAIAVALLGMSGE